MVEFFKAVFLGFLVGDFCAAEFSFELTDGFPGVVFSVGGGDSEEVVKFVAVLFGFLHDLPMEEVRSHDFTLLVRGSAIVISGGIFVVGDNRAGKCLAVVFGEVKLGGGRRG